MTYQVIFIILLYNLHTSYLKRIITCSDGTWNKPNARETNVQKLFNYIKKDEEKIDPVNGKKDVITQIKFYDEGVGTSGNFLTRIIDGITGRGIDENIKDIYKFICWNYEDGDEIYLFGFSRGAYTARSLAGLIRKCGIIKKEDLDLYEDAYDLYRDKSVSPDSNEAVMFRKSNSCEVSSIKFIGVWDTVGALGIPISIFKYWNKNHLTFYDTTLSSIVEYAYHAVAIDEKRKSFVPTLWEKSYNPTVRDFHQVLEQRWFSGAHSNIGGGYENTSLSDITLNWMLKKAAGAGLHIDQKFFQTYDEEASGELIHSEKRLLYYFLPKFLRQIRINYADSFVNESVFKRIKELQNDYPAENVIERDVIRSYRLSEDIGVIWNSLKALKTKNNILTVTSQSSELSEGDELIYKGKFNNKSFTGKGIVSELITEKLLSVNYLSDIEAMPDLFAYELNKDDAYTMLTISCKDNFISDSQRNEWFEFWDEVINNLIFEHDTAH